MGSLFNPNDPKWIKERYRTMRGYKVPENAVRVSRLLAWCGNFLNAQDGAILAGLLLTARATKDPHGFFLPDLWVPTIERSRVDGFRAAHDLFQSFHGSAHELRNEVVEELTPDLVDNSRAE